MNKRKITKSTRENDSEEILEKTIRLDESSTMKILKLTSSFYDISCLQLANDLLGKILVRKIDENTVLKARIVETECYPGGDDKGSHSYNGRKTPGNEPMYMPAGTSYVYMTYGMYHCFNISSVESGGAVLLRAVEPLEGLEYMLKERQNFRKSSNNKKHIKNEDLCNGPSKLCIAMSINKHSCNALNMITSNMLWIEEDFNSNNCKEVICSKRVGIDSAGPEAVNKLLRFYIFNNPNVSKRDKKQEERFMELKR